MEDLPWRHSTRGLGVDYIAQQDEARWLDPELKQLVASQQAKYGKVMCRIFKNPEAQRGPYDRALIDPQDSPHVKELIRKAIYNTLRKSCTQLSMTWASHPRHPKWLRYWTRAIHEISAIIFAEVRQWMPNSFPRGNYAYHDAWNDSSPLGLEFQIHFVNHVTDSVMASMFTMHRS
jgi:hypothetical protein